MKYIYIFNLNSTSRVVLAIAISIHCLIEYIKNQFSNIFFFFLFYRKWKINKLLLLTKIIIIIQI